MATAPTPRPNLAAAHDGVRTNLLSPQPPPQPLPLLPHQIFNRQNPAAFYIDQLPLRPSASGGDVGSDIIPPPTLPLLPHLEDLFHLHTAMLLRGHITRRLDAYGAETISAPEYDFPDDEISEDGLPEEVMIAKFLETAADGGDGEACAICLDDLQQEGRTVGVLRCRHGFHGECIGKWLRERNTCPLCRATAVDIL